MKKQILFIFVCLGMIGAGLLGCESAAKKTEEVPVTAEPTAPPIEEVAAAPTAPAHLGAASAGRSR